MFRSAKLWALAAILMVLMPVTIVCDVPGLDEFVEYVDVCYYDDCDCHHGSWYDCDDDEWFFDFDWWW